MTSCCAVRRASARCVQTDEGRGVVREVNLLAGKVAVLLDKSPDSPPVSFPAAEVRIVRDGKNRSEKSVAADEPAETQQPRASRPPRTRRADKAAKADPPANAAAERAEKRLIFPSARK